MPRLRVMATVVALALAAAPRPTVLAAAGDGARADPAHVVLVNEPGVLTDLAARILELVDVPGGVDVSRADRMPADAMSRAGEAHDRGATAWVSVDGSTASVRAADAARERFVHRELAVSVPLGELDRERLCDLVKSALEIVIEGGAPPMPDDDALMEVELPPKVLLLPLPSPVATQLAAAPAEPLSAPTLGWSVGAFYGARRTEITWAEGPGIVVAAWSNRSTWHLGGWQSVGYDVTREFTGRGGGLSRGGVPLRAGVSASITPRIDVVAGVGVDIVHLNAAYPPPWYGPSNSNEIVPVGRLAARVGIVGGRRLQLSATVALEVATRSVSYGFMFAPQVAAEQGYFRIEESASLHPGAALELTYR
jgi:hypothetical protein